MLHRQNEMFTVAASSMLAIDVRELIDVAHCWNMRLLDVETSCDDKNMIILSMNDCLNYFGRMMVVG